MSDYVINVVEQPISLISLEPSPTTIISVLGGSGGGSSNVAALDDLTDVTISSPVLNNVLLYNGSSWVNSSLTNSFIARLITGGTETIDYSGTAYDGKWRWQASSGVGSSRFIELQNKGNDFVGMTFNNAFIIFTDANAFFRAGSNTRLNFGNADEFYFSYVSGTGEFEGNEMQFIFNDTVPLNFRGLGNVIYFNDFINLVLLTKDINGSGQPVSLTWRTEAYGLSSNVLEIVSDLNNYYGYDAGAYILFKDELYLGTGGLSDGSGVTTLFQLNPLVCAINVPLINLIGTSFVMVGGRRAQNTTTVNNTGIAENLMHTLQINANAFSSNGDTAYAEFTVTTAANANNKRIRLTFDGTQIYDTGTQAWNGRTFHFIVRGMRMSSTTARWTVLCFVDGTPAPTASPVTTLTTSTDFISPRSIVLRGTGSSTNDISAIYSFLELQRTNIYS